MARSIARIVGSAAAVFFAGAAAAQAYPSKPITLIVPFAPGASADGIARIVGRELSQALGQPVMDGPRVRAVHWKRVQEMGRGDCAHAQADQMR